MADEAYETLADVYEWLVPDPLLTPEGSAEEFASLIDGPPARVLDCAAGIGTLGVGLALRGFDVAISDASAAMIARARALAAEREVRLEAVACPWEALVRQGWEEDFDAVLCVGNSLAHAEGWVDRRAALEAMASVLRPGGMLALTSRNWERLRATRPGLELDQRLVERRGRTALVVRGWTIPEAWEAPHGLEVAVALLEDDGAVTAHRERLTVWPFTHPALAEDLRSAGLEPYSSTYAPDVDRYLVLARRR
jgi:SAM-dependent methyltransferase